MGRSTASFDKFDLDSALDFDFDAKPRSISEMSKGEIVKETVGGAWDTIKSEAFDVEKAAAAFRNSLPDDAKYAWDRFDQVKGAFGDLYDQAEKEVFPAIGAIAKKLDNLVPDDFTRLKSLTSGAVDRFYQAPRTGGESFDSVMNSGAASVIAETFKETAVSGEKVEEANAMRQIASDAVNTKIEHEQFLRQSQILGRMDDNIQSMRLYQDKVLNPYQRKDLELNFRQYLTQGQMLRGIGDLKNILDNKLDIIARHTAMSEDKKITLSDRFKDMAKKRMIGDVQDKIFGDGSLITSGMKKLKRDGGDFIMGVRDGINMMDMFTDTAEMMVEGGEMTGKSAPAMAGEAMARMGLSKIREKVFGGLSKKLGKSKEFNDFVQYTRLMATNPNYSIEDLKKTELWGKLESSGVGDMATEALDYAQSLFKPQKQDAKIETNLGVVSDHDPAVLSTRMAVSVHTIIPGLLARILQSSENSRLGAKDTPLLTYNPVTGDFENENQIRSFIKRTLDKQASNSSTGYALKSNIEKMTKDLDISEDGKKALAYLVADMSDLSKVRSGGVLKNSEALKGLDEKTLREVESVIDKMRIGEADQNYKLIADYETAAQAFRETASLQAGAIQQLTDLGFGKLLSDGKGILDSDGKVIPGTEVQYTTTKDGVTKVSDVAASYFNIKSIDDSYKTKDELDEDAKKFRTAREEEEAKRKAAEASIFGRFGRKGGDQNPVRDSDIELKDNFRTFDKNYALEGVKKIPVTSWNYKTDLKGQPSKVGPMSQDVHKFFGDYAAPGGKKIDLLSLNGINMSAIQGLAQKVDNLEQGEGNKGKRSVFDAVESVRKSVDDMHLTLKDKTFMMGIPGIDLKDIDFEKLMSYIKMPDVDAMKDKAMEKARPIIETGNYYVDTIQTVAVKGLNDLFSFGVDKKNQVADYVSKFWSDNKEKFAERRDELIDGAIAFGERALNFTNDLIFNKTPEALNDVKDFLKRGKERLKSLVSGARDVYVRGNASPVLMASRMRSGMYVNRDTGEKILSIDTLLKTSSDVYDIGREEIAITASDIADGLYDEEGNKLNTLGTIALAAGVGAAKFVFDKAKNLASGVIEWWKEPSKVMEVLKGAWGSITEKFNSLGGFSFYDKRQLGLLVQIRDLVAIGKKQKLVENIYHRNLEDESFISGDGFLKLLYGKNFTKNPFSAGKESKQDSSTQTSKEESSGGKPTAGNSAGNLEGKIAGVVASVKNIVGDVKANLPGGENFVGPLMPNQKTGLRSIKGSEAMFDAIDKAKESIQGKAWYAPLKDRYDYAKNLARDIKDGNVVFDKETNQYMRKNEDGTLVPFKSSEPIFGPPKPSVWQGLSRVFKSSKKKEEVPESEVVEEAPPSDPQAKDLTDKKLSLGSRFSNAKLNAQLGLAGLMDYLDDKTSGKLKSFLDSGKEKFNNFKDNVTDKAKEVGSKGRSSFYENLDKLDPEIRDLVLKGMYVPEKVAGTAKTGYKRLKEDPKGLARDVYEKGKEGLRSGFYNTLDKLPPEQRDSILKFLIEGRGAVGNAKDGIHNFISERGKNVTDFGEKIAQSVLEKISPETKETIKKGTDKLKSSFNSVKERVKKLSPYHVDDSDYYDYEAEGLIKPTTTAEERKEAWRQEQLQKRRNNSRVFRTFDNMRQKGKGLWGRAKAFGGGKLGSALEIGKSALATAQPFLSKGMDFVKGLFGTTQQEISDNHVGTALEQVGNLGTEARGIGDGQKGVNDLDGDGERDGGLKDRLDKQYQEKVERKKLESEKAAAAAKRAQDSSLKYKSQENSIDRLLSSAGGLLGMMKDGIGGFLSGAMNVLNVIPGLGTLVSGLFKGGKFLATGAFKGVKFLGSKMLGGVLNVGSKAALGARAAFAAGGLSGVGSAALAATQGALTSAGAATAAAGGVVGGLGTLAIGATKVALAALFSPFMAKAAVVGAIGYGIYKTYKYFTRNKADSFQKLRLTQYGFEKAHDEQHRIMALESYFLDNRVSYGEIPQLLEGRIKVDEILEIFDIEKNDKERVESFMLWLNERFRPFFLRHIHAIYLANNKVKLEDADKLNYEELQKYLNDAQFLDGPYNTTESPFGADESIANTKEAIPPMVDALRNTKKKPKGNKEGSNKDSVVGDPAALANINAKKLEREEQDKQNAAAADKTVKASEEEKDKPKTTPSSKVGPGFAKETPSQSYDGGKTDPLKTEGKETPSQSDDGGKTDPLKPEGKGTSDSGGFSGSLPVAMGPLSRPDDGERFITKSKESVNINGLNPALRRNLLAMASEYGKLTGKTIQVNDGRRSTEEQARLHAKDPKKAAAPGRSLHEFGLGIDVASVTANHLEKLGLLRKYGFTRPVGGEPWHLEPAGIQSDINRAKKESSWATQMVNESLGRGGGGYGSIPGAARYVRNPNLAKRLWENASETKVENKNNESDKEGYKSNPLSPFKDSASPVSNQQATAIATTSAIGSAAKEESNKSASTTPIAKPNIPNPASGLKAKSSLASSTSEGESENSGVAGAVTNSGSGTGIKLKAGRPGIEVPIIKAAEKTGMNKNDLLLFAAAESSLGLKMGTPSSSAKGPFQFIDKTWAEQFNRHRRKYNLDPNSSVFDPYASGVITSAYLKENEKYVRKHKPKADIVDFYLSHMLGPGGVQTFLKTAPDDYPAKSMRKAANANPNVFYRNGDKSKPLTQKEMRSLLEEKFKKLSVNFGVPLNLDPSGSSATTSEAKVENPFEDKNSGISSPQAPEAKAETKQQQPVSENNPFVSKKEESVQTSNAPLEAPDKSKQLNPVTRNADAFVARADIASGVVEAIRINTESASTLNTTMTETVVPILRDMALTLKNMYEGKKGLAEESKTVKAETNPTAPTKENAARYSQSVINASSSVVDRERKYGN